VVPVAEGSEWAIGPLLVFCQPVSVDNSLLVRSAQ
jgi:hypothetical protein